MHDLIVTVMIDMCNYVSIQSHSVQLRVKHFRHVLDVIPLVTRSIVVILGDVLLFADQVAVVLQDRVLILSKEPV